MRISDRTNEEEADRRYVLRLLLFLLLLLTVLVTVYTSVIGILYLIDRYDSSGLVYTNLQQADQLTQNSSALDVAIVQVNSTLCNNSAPDAGSGDGNLTCVSCIDNGTVLLVGGSGTAYGTVINVDSSYTVVQVYINNSGTVTNVTQVVQQLGQELDALADTIAAIECVSNASLVADGVWTSGELYAPNTVVSHNGSTWLALLNGTDVVPGSNPSVWEYISGPDTIPGPPGPAGGAGSPGPNGTDATPCVNGTAGAAGAFLREAWNASTPYVPTDIVTHNGSMYEALTNNTASVPSNVSSDWQLLMQKGDKGDPGGAGGQGPQGSPPEVEGPWSDTEAYTVGQYAGFNGTTWQALTNNTNSTPVLNGSDWTLVAVPGTQGPAGPVGGNGTDCPALLTANYTAAGVGANSTINVTKINVQVGQFMMIACGTPATVSSFLVMAISQPNLQVTIQRTSASLSGTYTVGCSVFGMGTAQTSTIPGPQGSQGAPGANATSSSQATMFDNAQSFMHGTFCRGCAIVSASCLPIVGASRQISPSILTNNATQFSGDVKSTTLNCPNTNPTASFVNCLLTNGTVYNSQGVCCNNAVRNGSDISGARLTTAGGWSYCTLTATTFVSIGFSVTVGLCSNSSSLLTEIDVYATVFFGSTPTFDMILASSFIGNTTITGAPGSYYSYLTFSGTRQFRIDPSRGGPSPTFAMYVDAYDAGTYCPETTQRAVMIDSGSMFVISTPSN